CFVISDSPTLPNGDKKRRRIVNFPKGRSGPQPIPGMLRFHLSLSFVLGFYVDVLCGPSRFQVITKNGARNFAFKEWHFQALSQRSAGCGRRDELSEG